MRLYGAVESWEAEDASLLDPTMSDHEVGEGTGEPTSARRRYATSALLMTLAVGAMVAVLHPRVQWQPRELRAGFAAKLPFAAKSAPTITAWNSYTAGGQAAAGSYPYLTGGVILAEPYRETTLSVAVGDVGDSRYAVRWSFSDGPPATGVNVTHTFTSVGRSALGLLIKDSAGNTVSNTTHEVLVRYVRREVRSLSEDDRRDYLEAVKQVYTLKAVTGRKMYGTKFMSIQEFSAIYNQLTSDSDCDHIKNGMGFMTSHAGMLMSFERSIQSIAPHLSVPYWDYTIDSQAAVESGNSSTFYASPIFNEKFFGGPSSWTSDLSSEQVVLAGRLDRLGVGQNMWDYGVSHSVFGLARSPLNVNPEPFVTRHGNAYGVTLAAPTCLDNYRAMQSSTLESLHLGLEFEAFATIPMAVGGISKADMTFLQTEDAYGHLSQFAKHAYRAQWGLYRRGYMSVAEFCSTDDNGCRPTCTGLDLSSLAKKQAREILEAVHPLFVSSDADPADYVTNSHGTDISVKLLKALCNDKAGVQPQVGDMDDVGVNDPLFWSAFATVDRLWHWKRIQGLSVSTWPSSSCYGHGYTDKLTGIYMDLSSKSYLSNAELLQLTDPTTLVANMPYMYNSFEWAHCSTADVPADMKTASTSDSASSATAAARLEKVRRVLWAH